MNTEPSTVEGILAGRWGGHYVLLRPSVYESDERSYSLTGHLEVPAEKVSFVQVMS